jgi:hypothetical protein
MTLRKVFETIDLFVEDGSNRGWEVKGDEGRWSRAKTESEGRRPRLPPMSPPLICCLTCTHPFSLLTEMNIFFESKKRV